MPPTAELASALAELLGADFRGWALAWARVLPVVLLVPAFGLNAVALPIRIALAAALAVSIAPALRALPIDDVPFFVALAREATRSLPLALSTSALLWAAMMAGGLADNLRGGRETAELLPFGEALPVLSAAFGLLVAVAFLETGGAQRLALALSEPSSGVTFAAAAERLARSVSLAVAIAAPVLAGSALIEVAGAFVARAAAPAYVGPLIAPLRSLAVLCICWLALDRMVELFVVLAAAPL
jgi:type III secretory pathway component EscT